MPHTEVPAEPENLKLEHAASVPMPEKCEGMRRTINTLDPIAVTKMLFFGVGSKKCRHNKKKKRSKIWWFCESDHLPSKEMLDIGR